MTHPFLYVGHGVAAARKSMECFVCFRDPVAKGDREELVRGLPAVIAGYTRWFERALAFGNDDDSIQWTVRAAYDHVRDPADTHEPDPEMPSGAMWKAFNDDIDAWLLRVHERWPVALFVKPIDEEYSTETTAWHEDSCARIPADALPVVEALGKRHAALGTYLAHVWRGWVEQHPVPEQRAILAAVPDAARADLEDRDVWFKPTEAPVEPPAPTVDEAVAIWRELVAKPGPLRLEDAFLVALRERGRDSRYALGQVAHALTQLGRRDEAIELSRDVLASGAEFPTNWTPDLAEALVAAGRFDEAEAVVREVVGNLESYKPDMIAAPLHYHRARGEHDVEAMLYHAGMEWFTSFNHSITKAEAKTYGARPKDLPAQFLRWLERWCLTTHMDPRNSSRLGHWLVWFDKIGPALCASHVAAFKAERDRRHAVIQELEKAPDEPAARALAAQVYEVPGDTGALVTVSFRLLTRFPSIAYDLVLYAMKTEARTGYRYHTGNSVLGASNLLYLALNIPELVSKREEAYEIAVGFELVNNPGLHYNLGCVASRLGRRDDALRHVARALSLDFPDPKQIHDDNDLASFVGDPAYEEIFVVDAARRAAVAAAAAKEAAKVAARAAKKAAKAAAAKKPAQKGTGAAKKKSAAKKKRP